MSSLVLLILLYLLTLHACDARRLRLTDYENGKQVYHFSEDAENTKVFETSITSRLRSPTLEERISQQEEVKNNERDSNDSWGGVHKQSDPSVLSKKQEPTDGPATSGSLQIESCVEFSARNENTKVSSFHKDLQLARNTKGLKRNVRSLQVSVQHDSVETVDVKENEAAEDIAEMDYAQPHRKPPIHNEMH